MSLVACHACSAARSVGNYSSSGCEQKAAAFLMRGDPVTLLVCCRDPSAIGVLQVLAWFSARWLTSEPNQTHRALFAEGCFGGEQKVRISEVQFLPFLLIC